MNAPEVSTSIAAAKPAGAEVEVVEGKLLQLQLEGGFWGLITASGEKLRFVVPPPGEWKGSETVRVRLRRLEVGPSLQQWGQPVECLSIEPVAKRQEA
ncbi:MAG: hypothetical protein JNN01_07045 [Opitutaceae bacterium]|nr:hypothetical protein [Opitutaceae bacterium]